MFQLYELHCQVWDNWQCRQIVHWQQDPNAIHFATQSTIVIVRLYDNNNESSRNTQQTPMNQPSIGLNDLTDPINDDMPANWSTNWRTYLFKHALQTKTHKLELRHVLGRESARHAHHLPHSTFIHRWQYFHNINEFLCFHAHIFTRQCHLESKIEINQNESLPTFPQLLTLLFCFAKQLSHVPLHRLASNFSPKYYNFRKKIDFFLKKN